MLSRPCTGCGVPNDAGADDLLRGGICVSCKAYMTPLAEPLEVTEYQATELIRRAASPLLLEFFTPWSEESRAMATQVRKAAERVAGKGLILRLNAQAHPNLALHVGVREIPSTAVTWLGKVVAVCPGLLDADKLVLLLRQADRL